MCTLFNIYYLKTFNNQQRRPDFKIAYIHSKISEKSFYISFPDHSRFYIVDLPSEILAVLHQMTLCRGETKPWNDALLSREFTRNWIHSACTRADIEVDIDFRCVARLSIRSSRFSIRARDLRANGDIQSRHS